MPPPKAPSKVALFAIAAFEGIASLCQTLKNWLKKEVLMDPAKLWIDLLTKTNDFYEIHRTTDPFCIERTCLKEIRASKIGETTSKKFAFIASQLPSHYEFTSLWEELFRGSYAAIVDLTTPHDLMPGAENYYPEGQTQLGPLAVEFTGALDDRTFSYNIKTPEAEKTIFRYHFNHWIDHNAVSVETLLFLTETIEKKFHPSKKHPLWVHCRAGIGRTGTLITAFILKEKIIAKEINRENLGPALTNLIFELRKERSPYFVESFEQFTLLLGFGETLLRSLEPH